MCCLPHECARTEPICPCTPCFRSPRTSYRPRIFVMRNIALIGAGRSGRIHAAELANEPRLRLSHVVDAMPDAAADVAAATGATVATLETVLADPDIAGVVIASATDTHLDYSVRAITAGKAVFCEKPKIGRAHV